MKHPSFRQLRALGLGTAILVGAQSVATAQFDAQVTNIKWTQSVQMGANNNMAAGKPTFVRAICSVTNPPSDPVLLDGIMRVYVGGIEASFSPVFSDNGPYPASTAPASFNVEDDTINFIFVPPVSDDVSVEIEINPPGPNFVPEADISNNVRFSGPRKFKLRGIPELAYSPINYTIGGGLPNNSLIVPGVGDNMVQGMFGVPDWFYHRTDAPSKTWTTSLNSSGNGLNNSLLMDLNSMVPKPDFIYGWVPGGLPYNGVAIGIPGQAAIGNTQTFKHQRTFAHELGHLLGFPHNSDQLGFTGADVEEAMKITQNLGVVKVDTLNDIMVPGLNTNQAWISRTTFNGSFTNGAFAPGPIQSTAPGLMVTGLWNPKQGTLVLDNVLTLPAVRATQPVPAADAKFMVETFAGEQLIDRLPVAARQAADSCAREPGEEGDETGDSYGELPDVSVVFSLLNGAQQVDRLEISPVGDTRAAKVVLNRSANAPTVQFTTPGAGGDVSAGTVNVSWTASDADGDPLTYYLRYSRDGVHFSPLASGITETSYTVDVGQLPAFRDGQGFFEVRASDGLNTTLARSPSLHGSSTLWALGSNDPWVEIMTPDDGQTYLEGSTVILHSSGWDLEDRGLLDPALLWESTVDGIIGTGRLTSIATLTPGVHSIRVTATDSDGQTAIDVHQITIVARGLPDIGGIFNYCTPGTSASGCQAKLSATGIPSATAPSGFNVTAVDVEGVKDGLFFFGVNGRQSNTWGNGTSFQCVVPPTIRTGLVTGSGTLGACDGTAAIDLNATFTAIPAKNPGAGAVVDMQFWYRDPFNTSNQTTSLSDGLEFTVDP